MSRVLVREPAKEPNWYEHYTDYGHSSGNTAADSMWVYNAGQIIVQERHYTTHGDITIPSGTHYTDLFHGSYDITYKVITFVPPTDPKWSTRQPPPSIVALLSQIFPDAEELIYFH